jgi:hypothetical protein
VNGLGGSSCGSRFLSVNDVFGAGSIVIVAVPRALRACE